MINQSSVILHHLYTYLQEEIYTIIKSKDEKYIILCYTKIYLFIGVESQGFSFLKN